MRLREILESKDHASSASPLTVALGKDTAGNGVICDLNRISHLLIGGCSGSGKTSCIKSMIASIVYKASPAEVRFILAETKGVELDIFAGMPHLLGGEVVHAENLIVRALHWLSREITRRVNTFRERDVNSIKAYNKLDGIACDESLRLPYIVFIVDEIADLMNGDYRRQIEDLLVRIVPAARAVGVQLVLSSQQLNVKVISQTIRVNIPSRISFATVSNVDSRVILDDGGAETLSRRGDMLYAPITTSYSVRVQGAYVSDKELQAICDSVRADNEANFCEDFIRAVNGEYPD